ncbi:type I phosphomannose isomerase catalytic subunit [Deinococcus sp.]|uniref:type I phosphomannose isomerase catalytic subunit n=1 Tax=Deinococcus sp. TaxID=47478 RepID=UPI0025BAD69E|nr:type I phosphomannose isomerase catalytic subunit [Deinococcus sp.]
MTHPPTSADLPAFLPLTPRFQPRVWGGDRLAPPAPDGTPTGEAWIADGQSVVSGGPLAGQTVADLLAAHPAALLGAGQDARSGFPLLIKLLDCRDWLSVQVHPDDAQARLMVGPGERGKTEAWYFLHVEPGAQLLAGVKPGTTAQALADAIRGGSVLDLSQRYSPQEGDTLFIPAGTLHALGPGLLLYEVQQASDTTYRVFDWDRPASAGRAVHIEESVAVTDPERQGELRPAAQTGGLGELVRSEQFTLRGVSAGHEYNTGGCLALVTALSGPLTLRAGSETLGLDTYQTALIPAATGLYRLDGHGRALIAQPGAAPAQSGSNGSSPD